MKIVGDGQLNITTKKRHDHNLTGLTDSDTVEKKLVQDQKTEGEI